METRKLSGKHHRTNILQISQRVGIIVIVVATKNNPNCTPSKISRKSELGNPKLMKSPQSLDALMKAQPGHPVLSKGASKATAADDQIRWALTKFEKRWVYLKMDYPWISQIYSPLAILLALSNPGVLQASNFIQDSEFPNNFRLRTSRNPPRGFPRCVSASWFCATKDASFVKIRPFCYECVLFSMENLRT